MQKKAMIRRNDELMSHVLNVANNGVCRFRGLEFKFKCIGIKFSGKSCIRYRQ